MNTILEDVFLYDDVHGGKAVGFITEGAGSPGQPVGCIMRHELFGAVLAPYGSYPKAFLQPSHLKIIAERLRTINERQEKAR